MSLENPFPAEPPPVRAGRRRGVRIALVGAGIAAGAIGATAIGASAQGSNTGSAPAAAYGASTPSGAPSGVPSGAPSGAPARGGSDRGGPDRGGPGRGGPGGARPVRSDEKSVDGATSAKLKAAALKKVPGATVIRVETDSGDATYEAHLKKSDGTLVTVKFDKNLAVIGVEAGMGK